MIPLHLIRYLSWYSWNRILFWLLRHHSIHGDKVLEREFYNGSSAFWFARSRRIISFGIHCRNSLMADWWVCYVLKNCILKKSSNKIVWKHAVYPVDLLKTNVQQRSLSNHPQQLTGYQLFKHLLRERPPRDPSKQDTFVRRFLRLYRGLGVSAFRSFISWVQLRRIDSQRTLLNGPPHSSTMIRHGLTWTLIESISAKISQRTGRTYSTVPGSESSWLDGPQVKQGKRERERERFTL